jgi:DNA-binding MarR family transcriptional regulator
MSDPPVVRFFTEIAIIEHLTRTAAERVLPAGLSMAGFEVLNHLTHRGPTQSPAQIASAMQVTKGAMTGALKRLEAGGWVAIAPDPRDGRGKTVTLTAAGAAAREAGLAALAPQFAAVLANVGEPVLVAVLPLLRRVREHLDAARD